MFISERVVCNTKRSRLINEQVARGLLSNLGLSTPLSKVYLLGDILL